MADAILDSLYSSQRVAYVPRNYSSYVLSIIRKSHNSSVEPILTESMLKKVKEKNRIKEVV